MKEKATAYATYSAIVAASISAVFYISMATAPGDSSNTSIVTKIFMSSLGIVFTGGVFGLVGGLVGGIIGLCEGIDTVYGVSTQTVDQKRALLQKIIEER